MTTEPELEPVVPWRKGLSLFLRHVWTGAWADWDRTCRRCGVRMLRGDKEKGALPYYKHPSWPKWKAKPGECLPRPGAPAAELEKKVKANKKRKWR